MGSTRDCFRDPGVRPLADGNYTSRRTALLGARQAVNLARAAGADRDAPNELRTAEADLEQAEAAWRMRQPDRDIDIVASTAISSGATAEEMAIARRAARERREEIQRRA